MDNIKKKKYVKPKVTRNKLDAKTAVLGICKTTGAGGPRIQLDVRFLAHHASMTAPDYNH